jgi:hypothetical protein
MQIQDLAKGRSCSRKGRRSPGGREGKHLHELGKLEQQSESMSESASRPLTKHVYCLKTSSNASTVYTQVKGIMDPIKTLIDSGSSQNFINISYARKHSLPLIELTHTQSVIAINGKELPGLIRFRINLEITIEESTIKQRFYAMPLGDTPLILGMTWLKEANPRIN